MAALFDDEANVGAPRLVGLALLRAHTTHPTYTVASDQLPRVLLLLMRKWRRGAEAKNEFAPPRESFDRVCVKYSSI